ncbi:MAG: M20 family metallopeptidase [Clostridia bacterium]|nr:M20 family metallopeptidase [Clostridia bacterium]
MLNEIIRRRRALHSIPETGFDLVETSDFLKREISAWDCEAESVAQTGFACFFDAGKDETYAFRSDMDALNISEASGVDFCSTNPGKMHACGHDGHMAMMLALGDWASAHKGELNRNLLLIFQPAEEQALGAVEVIKSGVLERRRVSRVYALHVDPWTPLGTVTSRPGPMMARTSEVYMTFHGKSSHAAMAEKGIDALAAICEFICAALEMEKGIDADIPRLLKFGTINSGTAVNVISDKAVATGTMRAFSDEVYENMKKRLYEIADGVARKYGATYELEFASGACAVINDEKLFKQAQSALRDMDFKTMEKPVMIAEDFALYAQIAPIMMIFVGLGSGIPLHSPNFVMDERALECGARALIKLAEA